MAYALGTVGHVAMLRRTKAGPFTLDHAISLDNLNAFGQGAAQSDVILPLEAGLVDIPALDLSPEAAGAIRQGDRKSVVEGKSVSVRVDLGGRRIIKKKNVQY